MVVLIRSMWFIKGRASCPTHSLNPLHILRVNSGIGYVGRHPYMIVIAFFGSGVSFRRQSLIYIHIILFTIHCWRHPRALSYPLSLVRVVGLAAPSALSSFCSCVVLQHLPLLILLWCKFFHTFAIQACDDGILYFFGPVGVNL